VLADSNRDVWELWAAVQTQWRGAGMGIIGLDYLAVQQEADRLGIEATPAVMNKLRALEAATLRQVHAETDRKDSRTVEPRKDIIGRTRPPQKSARDGP